MNLNIIHRLNSQLRHQQKNSSVHCGPWQNQDQAEQLSEQEQHHSKLTFIEQQAELHPTFNTSVSPITQLGDGVEQQQIPPSSESMLPEYSQSSKPVNTGCPQQEVLPTIVDQRYSVHLTNPKLSSEPYLSDNSIHLESGANTTF